MSIDTFDPTFFVRNEPSQAHLPANTDEQAKSHTFVLNNNKVSILPSNSTIEGSTDLKAISQFVNTNLKKTLTADDIEPTMVLSSEASVCELNSLIRTHNDRVDSSFLIQLIRIIVLVFTLGFVDFASQYKIKPVEFHPSSLLADGSLSNLENPISMGYYMLLPLVEIERLNPDMHSMLTQKTKETGETQYETFQTFFKSSTFREYFFRGDFPEAAFLFTDDQLKTTPIRDLPSDFITRNILAKRAKECGDLIELETPLTNIRDLSLPIISRLSSEDLNRLLAAEEDFAKKCAYISNAFPPADKAKIQGENPLEAFPKIKNYLTKEEEQDEFAACEPGDRIPYLAAHLTKEQLAKTPELFEKDSADMQISKSLVFLADIFTKEQIEGLNFETISYEMFTRLFAPQKEFAAEVRERLALIPFESFKTLQERYKEHPVFLTRLAPFFSADQIREFPFSSELDKLRHEVSEVSLLYTSAQSPRKGARRSSEERFQPTEEMKDRFNLIPADIQVQYAHALSNGNYKVQLPFVAKLISDSSLQNLVFEGEAGKNAYKVYIKNDSLPQEEQDRRLKNDSLPQEEQDRRLKLLSGKQLTVDIAGDLFALDDATEALQRIDFTQFEKDFLELVFSEAIKDARLAKLTDEQQAAINAKLTPAEEETPEA